MAPLRPASAGLFFGLLAPRDFALYGLSDKISSVLVRIQHRREPVLGKRETRAQAAMLIDGSLGHPFGRNGSLSCAQEGGRRAYPIHPAGTAAHSQGGRSGDWAAFS
jgi:hypothetical protein